LVRLAAIVEVHAGSDGTRVRLGDGTELPVARDRVRALKDRLGLG
jgi:DNA-binding LytR/AlgR family response regulator